jgi:hypothetical protein
MNNLTPIDLNAKHYQDVVMARQVLDHHERSRLPLDIHSPLLFNNLYIYIKHSMKKEIKITWNGNNRR